MPTKELAVAITGVGGRMGAALREALAAAADLRLAAAVEHRGHAWVGRSLDGVVVSDELDAAVADVVVDFSVPGATARYATATAAAGRPFVSGTTGLEEVDRAALRSAAERVPVLWAPSMSLGVHVLTRLVEQCAAALGDGFDAEIVEMHHRFKEDAPSGTAARLAEALQAVRPAALVHGRQGRPGPRPASEIGVHALRGGGVAGDHTVFFIGAGERIELTHRAFSRATFAEGAFRAARFLVGRPAGSYTIDDVLAFVSEPGR